VVKAEICGIHEESGRVGKVGEANELKISLYAACYETHGETAKEIVRVGADVAGAEKDQGEANHGGEVGTEECLNECGDEQDCCPAVSAARDAEE